MSAIEVTFSPTFAPMVGSNRRYIDLMGGRGRGGSFAGTSYFLFLITQPKYFRGYFLRNTFNDIRDSLFRDFKDRIDENPTIRLSDFNIQENEMRITYKPTGNMIMSKGAKKDGGRTAKMKSLAGATHCLIEEADEFGEEDFDQLDDSLRTTKVDYVQIIRVFNPPFKQHWIWRDYILLEVPKPASWPEKEFPYFYAKPKTGVDLLSIFSTYKSNIVNVAPSTIEKFEGYRIRKPEYYFTVIKGLISEGQKGRIFRNWQSITDEQFNEIDARSIIGIDFGVGTGGIVEVKIVKNRLYLRQLYYGGATAKELAIKLCVLGIKNELIIADSADPLKIGKLRNGIPAEDLTDEERQKYPQALLGWTVYGANKGKGSLISGIQDIQDFDVFLTENSSDFWKEYREYKWALDKNKNPTDDPIDDFNHLHDPTRYVVLAKGRYF